MQLKHQNTIYCIAIFINTKNGINPKKFKHKIGNVKITYHVRPNKNPEKEECM